MAKSKNKRAPGEQPTAASPQGRTLVPRPSEESLARPDSEAALRASRVVARPAPPARLTASMLLRKLCELSVMSAFIGAVITYNLMAPLDVANGVRDLAARLNGGSPPTGTLGGPDADTFLGTLVGDLEPLLMGGMPVLESKAAVFGAFCALAVLAFAAVRLLEAFSGAAILPAKPVGPRRLDWRRLAPLACAGGFLVWSLVSISPFGWGPEPPPEAMLGPGFDHAGGGYTAFVAWVQLALAVLFFFVAEDLLRTRRVAYKILLLVGGLGLLAAAIAVLVKINFPLLSSFWMKIPSEDYRNDVGSLVGHNAALSSFLMGPMLLGYAVLASQWERLSRASRGAIIGGLLVGAMALVLAQSRAVIPILGVMFVVLVVLLRRRVAIKPGLGLLVGGPLLVLALVATQLINAPWNPLYRDTMPLGERVQALAPEHLKSETRLRMLVASLPAIASRPLQGSGWNTFQYEFPVAQGEYYAANPESEVVPTAKRSQHAHNEYLQVLFETGLVGLVLALAAVVAILAAGWNTLTASINRRHTAIQLAIWVSLLASLLHMAVDFQTRVPPSAASFLLLLAVWSAGDRLWIVRAGSGETQVDEPSPAATRVLGKHRVLLAGWTAGFALLLSGMAVVGARASDWITASLAQMAGRQFSEVAQRAPGGTDLVALGVAERHFRVAQRLAPLMGNVGYDLGRVAGLRFIGLDRERQRLAQEGNELGERARRAQMLAVARAGIDQLDRALLDTRFHGVYTGRSNLKMLASRVATGEEAASLRAGAIDDMRAAVAMNPGDWTAMGALIGWLREEPNAERTEIAALEASLAHFHPWFFDTQMLPEVNELQSLFSHQAAARRMRELVEAAPGNEFYQLVLARCLAAAGQLDESESILRRVPMEVQPLTHLDTRVRIAVRRGELERGLQLARSWDEEPDAAWQRHHFELLALVLRSRLPEDAAAGWIAPEVARQRIADLERRDTNMLTFHAQVLYPLLDDVAGAMGVMQRRIAAAPASPLSISDHMLMVLLHTESLKQEIPALMAAQAAAREAGEPMPRAEGATRDGLLAALDHAREARRLASTAVGQRTADQTLRQIELLLGP